LARYFAISYRALATQAGREFLHTASVRDAPAVHGYSTAEDLVALIDALQPSPADVVVDLGCGIGEMAIALHRRTRCRVVGIDASGPAIAEARRRADEAGVAAAIGFELGDLGKTTVNGSAAYALDSLMFVPRAPGVLAGLSRSLQPPGRVFATFIDHRGLDRDSFARYLTAGGIRLEQLEDVTAQFADQNRRRAAAARRVYRARPWRSGRLGLLLVLAEEATVSWLIRRGRLRRWRFTIIRPATVPSRSSSDRVAR
jgi:2-polyprenyl-3-methyl-5-hydroxy-6-metoxy-1,4-benzoquinol methylase